MSKSYFVQECPTCGRCLHVRVEYLGRQVICQHCRSEFVAWDPEGAPPPAADSAVRASDSGIQLLRRADQLLELAQQRLTSPD